MTANGHPRPFGLRNTSKFPPVQGGYPTSSSTSLESESWEESSAWEPEYVKPYPSNDPLAPTFPKEG